MTQPISQVGLPNADHTAQGLPAIRSLLVLAWLTLTLASGQVHATTVERLLEFFSSQRSGQMNFVQTSVYPGKPPRVATGKFNFSKPNRIRWSFLKPDRIDLISDGKILWQYDHELRQAIKQDVKNGFGATPAALFAGEDPQAIFHLAELPDADGLSWVEATPKQEDPAFSKLQIGLNAQGKPVKLFITDNLRQSITLELQDAKWNVAQTADTFQFTPPKGVEVLTR